MRILDLRSSNLIGSHVIPRRYLAQFADSEGRIWVYEKDRKPRKGTPKGEGVENGYFGYRHRDGKLDETLESILAQVEDEAGTLIQLFRNPCYVPSPLERRRMARYIGLMFSRATARREASDKIYKEYRDLFEKASQEPEWLARYARGYTAFSGRVLPLGEFAAEMRRVLRKMKDPAEARNMFLLTLVANAEKIADELLAKAWKVWKTTEKPGLVTSDNPVITLKPDSAGHLGLGWGFRQRGVVTIFPLSPDSCLVIGSGGPYSRNMPRAVVDEVNKGLIMSMHRCVYCADLHEEINQLVREVGAQMKYLENAFVIADWKKTAQKYFDDYTPIT